MGCCRPPKVMATKPLKKDELSSAPPTIHFVQVNNLALPSSRPLRDVVTSTERSSLQQKPNQLSLLNTITISPTNPQFHVKQDSTQPTQQQSVIKVRRKVHVNEVKLHPYLRTELHANSEEDVHDANLSPSPNARLEVVDSKTLCSSKMDSTKKDLRHLKRYSLDNKGLFSERSQHTQQPSSNEELVVQPKQRRSLCVSSEAVQGHALCHFAHGFDPISSEELSRQGESAEVGYNTNNWRPALSSQKEIPEFWEHSPNHDEAFKQSSTSGAKILLPSLYKKGGSASLEFKIDAEHRDSADNLTAKMTEIKAPSDGLWRAQHAPHLQRHSSLNPGDSPNPKRFSTLGHIMECDSELEMSIFPEKRSRGSRLLGFQPHEKELNPRRSLQMDDPEVDKSRLSSRPSFRVAKVVPPQKSQA